MERARLRSTGEKILFTGILIASDEFNFLLAVRNRHHFVPSEKL
jgi:hypothetical protein